jgi:hypothetical protein
MRIQQWLSTSGAATECNRRVAQSKEDAERQLLRDLLARYPDERVRGPDDRVLPAQTDLFV